MSADSSTGARLRAARQAARLTVVDLAEAMRDAAPDRVRARLPKLRDLERTIRAHEAGQQAPGPRYRLLYAAALSASEDDLFGPDEEPTLWRPPHSDLDDQFDQDDEHRLELATIDPARVDLTVVESLATILAMQRRLDDTLGPAVILPSTAAQASTAAGLLRAARGKAADALAPVAAEWVQFRGWLHAERGDHVQAGRLLTDAEDMADEINDGVLAAQASNFKGYVARQQSRPRGVVRHFMAAYTTPGASAPQRLGDAVQAAHGYALLGDHAAARRLLGEAEALAGRAARETPPGTAYWLSPDFQHINIGLALLALGERAAAAQHLAAGLDSLPADQQGAEWTREYRDAVAEAEGGG